MVLRRVNKSKLVRAANHHIGTAVCLHRLTANKAYLFHRIMQQAGGRADRIVNLLLFPPVFDLLHIGHGRTNHNR